MTTSKHDKEVAAMAAAEVAAAEAEAVEAPALALAEALAPAVERVHELNEAPAEPVTPATQPNHPANPKTTDAPVPASVETRAWSLQDGTVAVVRGDASNGGFTPREALMHDNGTVVHVDPDEAPGIVDGSMGHAKQWTWQPCNALTLV